MSKKRIIKIVEIAFWTIILIGTAFSIYNSYWLKPTSQYSFIDTAIKWMLLITICLAIRIVISKAYKSKLSKIDLKNDNYYREIIHKYSPAVLKYIDNFEFGDAIIIVILMGLKLKGIINSELEIINKDLSKLDLNEKYICININKLKNINIEKLECTIIHDCNKHKLLEDDKSKKDISGKLIAFFIIGLPLIIIILGGISNMLLVFAVAIAEIMLIVFVVYYTAFDAVNYLKPYKRTQKGEAVNEKLEGLKNFLEEYSSLENKSAEELALWEDYLIYSVMFNQNEKIIKQYQEKIDRM